VIQPILHLHVCADPAPTESAATTKFAPTECSADLAPAEFAAAAESAPAESAAAESAAEPLHSIAEYTVDSAATGATPTEAF
jgi:hypothetical protein